MKDREEMAYRQDPLVGELGTMARIAKMIQGGEYSTRAEPVELLRRIKVNPETGKPEIWVLNVDVHDELEVTRFGNLADQWDRAKGTQAGRIRFDTFIWSEMRKLEEPNPDQ